MQNENTNVFIFLDDERNVEDVFWNEKTKQMSEMSDKTFVVRNFAEFVDCIDKIKHEDHISLSLSLDHDLCDFHVRGRRCDDSNLKDELFQYGFQNKHGHSYGYNKNLNDDNAELQLHYYEFTGYSCLKYLADCFDINDSRLSNLLITIHSKNEIAKQTMINFIEWHWQSSYE